ncbi:hypothetical protein KDH_01690 [Dictyobacter sp. S3.2.2.5]|uniref:histidine kinase n=1 Tax=Dictyobacter halimunensis TaxID=3026934 RepID=A0ABQ6FIA2_9CHLR|nr:hypothetical protein KDH_01690 [Dictyobacter sp. S3.2.2.5]
MNMDQDQALQYRPKRNKQRSQRRHIQNVVLQQGSESLLVLIHAIARIPEFIDTSLDEGILLLSSSINFVGQYLADLIRQKLGGEQVILFSLTPSTGRLHYVTISGFSTEQEQRCRERNGRFTLTDLFDEASIRRLTADKEVIIAPERTRPPFVEVLDASSKHWLLTPILLKGQLAGGLAITKVGRDKEYTPAEITLVRAIAEQTAFVLASYFMANRLKEMQNREQILQETEHLINDFLSLVSHELRTPLTVVMGNIQLAQRRLQTLQQQVVGQPETLNQQANALSKQAEALNQQAEALSKQAEALSKQAETLSKQAEALNQRAEALNQQAEALSKQAEALNQQAETLSQQAEALSKRAETSKQQAEALSKGAETLSKGAETLSKGAETLSKQAETLSQQAEALNQQAEALNQRAEVLNQRAEVLNQQAEILNQRAEALNQRAETLSQQVEQIHHPLESAALGARVQKRMIDAMIDDADLQMNTFTLHMKRCNVVKLVQEAVREQQQQVPERTILLNIMPTMEPVPIIADVDRIKKVVTVYLVNALTYSPDDQPVTVQLAIEDAVARVSVHDEGWGIPSQEQKRVWERFYHIKGHEFDLSIGLDFYLCKQFIKRHQGEVGLESTPGKGSIFWFTLPIARS